MWVHYPTSRRKKMLTALTKSPDSHSADHNQATTVCRRPPFFVGDALALKNYAIRVPCGKGEARRVQPAHEQLYLYQFPDQALLPLTFRPLGRGQGDAIEKLKKCTLLFASFSWEGIGMVHKVPFRTHVTATHNPTTKQHEEYILIGKSGVRTGNNNESRTRVRVPVFLLKFERSNFTPVISAS